jgi:hypothetical protein
VADGARPIPKIVWSVWFQGLARRPELVRRCQESWQERNPGWRVVLLDDETIPAHASLDYGSPAVAALWPNHRSDLLRLDLLSRHGGVWADGTVVCARPLDEWLPAATPSGFFAFAQPAPTRVVSSWFLAAAPGNPLVARWFERMRAYWDRPFRNHDDKLRRLGRLLDGSPRRRALWFSRPVRDWLAATPYYAVHYGFEQLVRTDPEAAAVWLETPRIPAAGPQRLLAAQSQPPDASLRAAVDAGETPVYKFNWKVGDGSVVPGSTLAYLLGGD